MCEVSSILHHLIVLNTHTISVWDWISLNASLLRAPQYRAKTSFFPSHFSYWLFPICQTRLGRCWNHFFPKSTSNKFSSEGGCEGGGCYPYVSPLSGRPQSRTDINIFRWWAPLLQVDPSMILILEKKQDLNWSDWFYGNDINIEVKGGERRKGFKELRSLAAISAMLHFLFIFLCRVLLLKRKKIRATNFWQSD